MCFFNPPRPPSGPPLRTSRRIDVNFFAPPGAQECYRISWEISLFKFFNRGKNRMTFRILWSGLPIINPKSKSDSLSRNFIDRDIFRFLPSFFFMQEEKTRLGHLPPREKGARVRERERTIIAVNNNKIWDKLKKHSGKSFSRRSLILTKSRWEDNATKS